MDSKLRRRVAIGATGLAVAACAGGAYAATSGSGTSDRQAFLNDVAKRLHVSSSDLKSAIKGALYDRLDAEVKAGRLTQAQADAIKKRIEQSGGVPFFAGPPPGGPGKFFGHRGPALFFGGGPFLGGLDAAAKYLDLTDAQLRDRLESGKSLAQIAQDQNKSVDGLKTALKDAAKAKLDQAVKDKRLTQAQEDRILADLDSRIDDFVNDTPPGPPGRPGFFFHGGPFFGVFDAAAKYLDLTDAQLRDRLESGKSLAQVAQDQNKSVDGLKTAIKDAAKTRLDEAVKDNRLTQAQEDRILAELDSHLDDIVNNTKPPGPPVGPGGPPWGGPHGGP